VVNFAGDHRMFRSLVEDCAPGEILRWKVL
jgi:hypothetical protein